MDIDAMGLGQLCGQFIKCDLALGGDAGLDPAGYACQLAVPATVALGARCQRSGFAPELDQFVHEPRRNPEMPRRLAVPVAFIDIRNNACSQLYPMRLAHR